MPNVGVEKHWRDKCLSPKRQSGTNAGVGQTLEWTNAGFLGQTSEWTNTGVPNFFFNFEFFLYKHSPPYLRPVTFLS
jgi:hypothetical protein